MRVCVCGGGHTGTVTAAGLAELGHEVVMTDVSRVKLDLAANGIAPIAEPRLSALIATHRKDGRLRTADSIEAAVAVSEVTVLALDAGAPGEISPDQGSVGLLVQRIAQGIAAHREDAGFVLRTPVQPGMLANLVLPTLFSATKRRGAPAPWYGVFPAFLARGSALADFFTPSARLLGADTIQALELLRKLTAGIDAKEVVTPTVTAEAAQFAGASWAAMRGGLSSQVQRIASNAGGEGEAILARLEAAISRPADGGLDHAGRP